MKKGTITIISVVMGLSFAALLYLQVSYLAQMLEMRKEQFAESVAKSLNFVSRNMEMEQTIKGFQDYIKENNPEEIAISDSATKETVELTGAFPLALAQANTASPAVRPIPHPVKLPKGFTLRKRERTTYSAVPKEMKELIKKQYIHQRELLDKVTLSILFNATNQPLEETVNFKMLDQSMRSEFKNNGINIDYHFRITTPSGKEIYRCPDYTSEGEDAAFQQILMPNNAPAYTGILSVHFPEMGRYLFRSVTFLIPSIIFTIILLITFIFTICISFRQKKLSEMKNDLVNNMTHELKTPVSSISLAVQMLLDPNFPKTENSTKHLSTIISDETKRLRMLIDVVLQTSIVEGKKIKFNKKELMVNKLLNDTASTFSIKARKEGGTLETDFQAIEDTILADEMHLTNVFFNIMDNAYKYRNKETEFLLKVSTWNEGDNICIAVSDNGIGIKHDDLKKIFEKFYRVHTGNRHDVKGFGLGLAYVKNIVDMHNGKIRAESELGKGTTFIITLPTIKEE